MNIKRRGFLKGTAGALCVLAGRPGWTAFAAEPDRQTSFPFNGETPPPDPVRILAGYLSAYEPPAAEMSPSGGWTAFYDIVSFDSIPAYLPAKAWTMRNGLQGAFSMTLPKNFRQYHIRQSYNVSGNGDDVVEADLACADDSLSSIQSWGMTWSFPSDNPAAEFSYQRREGGVVDSGDMMVNAHGRTESITLSQPLTTLWTMIDRVRLMPAKDGWSEQFEMYMDLSSLRRNQTLTFLGRGTLALKNGPQTVFLYEQSGEGSTPIHYAVDEQQRTLFVTQAQLAWALHRVEAI